MTLPASFIALLLNANTTPKLKCDKSLTHHARENQGDSEVRINKQQQANEHKSEIFLPCLLSLPRPGRRFIFTTSTFPQSTSTMSITPWQFGNRRYNIKVSDNGIPGLQGSPVDMSSLSRRACYKCGNVGHYAGQSRAGYRRLSQCKLIWCRGVLIVGTPLL